MSVGVVKARGVKGKIEGAPSPPKALNTHHLTCTALRTGPHPGRQGHGTKVLVPPAELPPRSPKEGEGLRLVQMKKQESPPTRSKWLHGNKKP